MSHDERQRMWRLAGRYSTVGLEMVLGVVLGMYGGRWLDGALGTEPYLFYFGLACGFGASVNAVLRAVRMSKRDMR